ncbi:hypothetical protein K9M41_00940 [Candidatus Gracilibacteria bacterium]|nr:hypothetical protein [Candidatus Gracilibacteria bacterium]
MKKLLLLLTLLSFSVGAQNAVEVTENDTEQTFEQERIIPLIDSDDFVEFGKRMLFDASRTKKIAPSYGAPVFSWDFGDETRMQWGEQIAHSFVRPGRYTVTLKVRQGREREELTKEVIVFDTQGILVADSKVDAEEVVLQAGEHGIWLKSIPYEKAETGFSAEEEFIRLMQENLEFVQESNVILFYTKSAAALQDFAQFWRRLSPEKKFDVKEKLWVQIFPASLDKAAKLTQPIFKILKPDYILLTRPEALNPIFEQTKDGGGIIEKLKSREIEFWIIDERTSSSPLLVFSNLTTYFVSNGVSQNVIYLLFVVPFIVFVIAFLRQFVGVATFGVYSPLMLALSFLVLGLKFGVIVFLIVMLVSYLIRIFFEKVELLYIPKVSLLLSMLSLSFFLVLGLMIYFDSSLNLTLTIFPMLVMATLSEKFLAAQASEGMRYALIIAGKTVIVSLLAYFLVTWGWLENAILALPEIILLPILGNVWLGRFTGLRLTEYFKFRALFREDSYEEE